jgi:hypothetical protein
MTRRYELFVFSEDDFDEVARLYTFRAEHPNWKVGYDASWDLWRAHRTVGDGGSEEHVRYSLKDLLDKLDSLPDA